MFVCAAFQSCVLQESHFFFLTGGIGAVGVNIDANIFECVYVCEAYLGITEREEHFSEY